MVLTVPVGFAVMVKAFVAISVGKVLQALSVLDKLGKVALVVAGVRGVETEPVGFVARPLSDVLIPVFVSPQPVTLHTPILKLPHVVLILESEFSLPVGLVVLKLPHIHRPVGEPLPPTTALIVETELPLVGSVTGEVHPNPVFHPPVHSAKVETLFLRDDCIVGLVEQLLEGEQGLVELVVLGGGEVPVVVGRLFGVELGDNGEGFLELEGVADHMLLHFIALSWNYISPIKTHGPHHHCG